MSVAVIGAGIIGLSCAVEIQKSYLDAKVTLIADQFSPNTVTDVAAGQWRPIWNGTTDVNLLRKWGLETFKLMQKLNASPEASSKYGVGFSSGYDLYTEMQQELPFWNDIVFNFRRVPQAELRDLGWPQYKDGFFYSTYYMEPTKYLDYLLKEFKNLGGNVIEAKVSNFDEIEHVCKRGVDLVINATGHGAYWLANDKKCFPIRGQIYKVRMSSLKHFVKADDLYILLNNNQVILGGCHQHHDFRTNIDESDSKRIWDGCLKLVPALKDCKVIGEYCALRPGRSEIRLDLEYVTFKGQATEKPIIHCYGHAGSGISLFYGCARDVVELCKRVLTLRTNASKL